MADIGYWEKVLITEFASPQKKERYKALLKGRKNRRQFLDLLNHHFEYKKSNIISTNYNVETKDNLMTFLRRHRVISTCYLMADQNENDGYELRLELGIEELINNYWGTIIICPPKPILVYKPEAPGKIVLLQKTANQAI